MFKFRSERLSETEVLLHCEVGEWSLSVARELDIAVDKWFRKLARRGYRVGITVSPNQKFCEYMGGEPMGSMIWEGKHYGVYKWELQH